VLAFILLAAALATPAAALATTVTPMVAAGSYDTYGVRSNGTVLVAGRTGDGENGVLHWSNISTVSAGSYFAVGLRADGSVVATGSNQFHQCEVSGWSGIKQVACAGFYTVGLRGDGSVVATGQDWAGSCSGASGWTGMKAIGTGFDQTLGVMSDGSVVATGNPANGCCNVSGWEDIKAVGGGYHYSVGLSEEGTCVAVGKDDGDYPGQVTNLNDTSVWNHIKAISAGYSLVAGLKDDGTVITSVDNLPLTGFVGITSVAVGNSCVVGLKSNGTLVTATFPGYIEWHALDVGSWNLIVSPPPPTPISTKTAITTPSGVKVNHTLRITGTVSPWRAPGKVTIIKTRLVGKKWKSAGSPIVSVVGGKFSHSFKPAYRGKWKFVATYSGGRIGLQIYRGSKSITHTVKVK
jgi:hypothetical protein